MEREVGRGYLSAGSNLGDRIANLTRGLETLAEAGVAITRVSSYFETEPVGFADQPWFLNVAVEVETRLEARELLERCRAAELALGRIRSFRNAPRPLDLDLLLYGDRVIAEPDLIVPHPRMIERRFVLEPLAEIAPDAFHPLAGLTIRELLARCPDACAVRRYAPGGLP